MEGTIQNDNLPETARRKIRSCLHVAYILENIENPIQLLRFAWDSLLPNGMLVISVPNEDSLIHLRYPYFTGDGNHLYSFSENNMDELLEYTGFEMGHHHYDYQTAMRSGRATKNSWHWQLSAGQRCRSMPAYFIDPLWQ